MSDDRPTPRLSGDDFLTDDAAAEQTVTNDAVAGETVLPGTGDGNDGPTGGAPHEQEPDLPENELDADAIDLEDEE